MKSNKVNLLDLYPKEIEIEITKIGEKSFRAKQIFQWISRGIDSFDDMSDLSKDLREKLKENFEINLPKIKGCLISKVDKTRKYLFSLNDGNIIESVLMFYKHGASACISTQIGCKMGCKFCASTGVGFVRDLTCGEMLGQIIAMQKDSEVRIGNVVLMGIGEPLDNFNNVERFLTLLNHKEGLNVSLRHVSISTCGLVPEIVELMKKNLQVTLSISLHAGNDKIRDSLMPINKKYPIKELINICKEYTRNTKRRISFEYALINGVNDSIDDAKLLVELLRGMLCHVNLIPVNEVSGTNMKKSNREKIEKFKNFLIKNNINATVRRELGSDINAACGQLRRSLIEQKVET